jgi:TolB-like protein
MFVIARNTAFTFKGKPTDAKQIGRELGVRYVLEGSSAGESLLGVSSRLEGGPKEMPNCDLLRSLPDTR